MENRQQHIHHNSKCEYGSLAVIMPNINKQNKSPTTSTYSTTYISTSLIVTLTTTIIEAFIVAAAVFDLTLLCLCFFISIRKKPVETKLLVRQNI